MSVIEDLHAKRKRLRSQLDQTEISLRDAILEAHPRSVGDIVRVTSPDSWRRGSNAEEGVITSLRASCSGVAEEIRPFNKTRTAPRMNATIFVSYNATVEVIGRMDDRRDAQRLPTDENQR